ncbi:MAG: glycosyltransferase [Bacteroidetes bacterium]|nr:glycosyltransferase [Bacteroidota bacterium]
MDKKFEIEEIEDQGIFTVRVYYLVGSRQLAVDDWQSAVNGRQSAAERSDVPTHVGIGSRLTVNGNVNCQLSTANCNTYSKFINTCRFIKANLIGYRHILKQRGKPDVIHVHVLTRLGIFALYLKICKSTPYIITEHWSRYLPSVNTYKGCFRKLMTKIVVRYASAVTTPTVDLENAMLRYHLYNKNFRILPNVVDTDKFLPFKVNSGMQPGALHKKRMVHVSCFEDRSKNISGILNVLKRLSVLRDDWECYLVGEGIDREWMIKRSEDLGLTEWVHFTGLLEGKDLVEAISTSDFMVLFSNYENLPVVINEAFACGVPVVATAVGGIPEVVNTTRGLLVRAGDEDDLLRKIEWMLVHHNEFDKEKIREYTVLNYGTKAVSKLLNELYDAAIYSR